MTDWVCRCRLPFFYKSELFYEYKICHALVSNNEGSWLRKRGEKERGKERGREREGGREGGRGGHSIQFFCVAKVVHFEGSCCMYLELTALPSVKRFS